jgi:hypothetical protein
MQSLLSTFLSYVTNQLTAYLGGSRLSCLLPCLTGRATSGAMAACSGSISLVKISASFVETPEGRLWRFQ